MRCFALLFLALSFWPATVIAQSARIEALLERQLSGDGRIVEIDGFAGALSSQARMDALRISDDTGVWLELENAVLDWDRSALLRGRLDVTALTATRLSVLRAPQSTPSAPDAEASGFRIPDLPIAIAVDRFAIERIELGAPLLGAPYVATLEANAALNSDGVVVVAQANRLDAARGEIQIDLSFGRQDEVLALVARIDEADGGIVATSLGLPGDPALVLDISGEGPLDDFAADIGLATDGQDRLSGAVSIAAMEDGSGRRFNADVSGDLRPLLDAETRAFFGARTALRVEGLALEDGGLDLSQLDLQTAQLAVTGRALLDATRAPQELALQVNIEGDAPVKLPGSDVTLQNADLSLAFDAAQSPDWTMRGTVNDARSGQINAELITLNGTGQIAPNTDTPLSGRLTLSAQGVDAPTDPALAQIIGPQLSLQTNLTVQDTGAVALDALRLETPHSTAEGTIRFAPTDGRLQMDASLNADLPTLAPYSGVAGLPLTGAIVADVALSAELPGGAITVSLDGLSEGLDIGQPVLSPLLTPDTQLGLAVTRDETGTRIERFSLENSELTARARGDVDAEDGAVELTATLRDAAFFDPRLAGAVDLTAAVRDIQNTIAIDTELSAAFGLDLNLVGTVAGDAPMLKFDGTLQEVERFAAPLNGPATLDGMLDLGAANPVISANVSTAPGIAARIDGPLSGPNATLRIAADVADLGALVPALPGPATARGTLDMSGTAPRISATVTAQPAVTAQIDGALSGAAAELDILAEIENLAPCVAQLPGPARLKATVSDFTGDLAVMAELSAPKGLSARVQGTPLGDAGMLNLTADLSNLGVFVPQLPGPANIAAVVRDPVTARNLSATLSATGLDATVDGTPDALALTARLDRLNRFAPGLAGGANVSAQLANLSGTPDVDVALRTDTGATASINGRVDVPQNASDLNISGSLPLGLASAFVGDRALSGSTDFNMRLTGPLQLSSLAGRVQISGARLFDPAIGLTVNSLDATADIGASRAQISAGGTANEGQLGLNGTVGLSAPFQTDLDMRINGLIYAIDTFVRTRVDATLALRGPASRRLAVSGDVGLFDTEIRVPDTGLGGAEPIPDIEHVGAPSSVLRTQRRAGVASQSGNASQGGSGPAIPLDVRITARDPIFVRGRGLDAAFGGALLLGGTAAAPEPVGQFNLQRGRLDFLGRRLELTEGRVVLSGTQVPRIRVIAETVLESLTAQIIVEGPADAPEINITSSPQLPEDEVLAMLLFGRSFDTLSPFQVARLISSIRTLAGKGNGILDGTRRVFGLDDLDVRTDETTGETELSFGRRISEDVYSEVEVGSQGEVQLNLNLDIGRNTRLRGSASNSGDTGIGIFWERDY